MTNIVLGKEYKTRDGGAVIIDDLDGHAPYVVRGRIKRGSVWSDEDWLIDGKYLDHPRETILDLVPVEGEGLIEREVWINFYEQETRGYAYPTKEQADRSAGFDREACVCVVVRYNKGEGL
jgi:hypothetical protein